MKNAITLSISLLISLLTLGQNFGEIHGHVKSSLDGTGVAFASIAVTDGMNSSTTQTDGDGKFKIKTLIPGTYEINVKHVEHTDYVMKNVVVLADDITFLNEIEMILGKDLGGEVQVYGWREPLIRPGNPGLIPILATDLRQSANGKSTIKTVSQLPGITISKDGKELYFRGSRPESINTFIDGVKQMGSYIPSVPQNAIKSVNVYTGGIPASFGDVTGGVILIKTKTYMDFYNSRK